VPRVADFLRANPEVRLALDLSDRLSALAVEGFDLAIRHAASVPDTHVAWQLCATRSVLVASRAYLRRRPAPQTPQALSEHDCLHYPRADTPAWTLESSHGRRAPERVTIPVAGPFAANNSEALRDAALAGLGIALVPDFSAQAALQAGKLVQVLPQWTPVGAFAGQLYAVRPYASHVPRAVTVFVAWLRASLKEGFAA
jgi:DNA-binding transcriptional LysR family regulator